MTKYSLETKLAAVRAYLEGGDSFQVTAQKHNVSVSMLKKWVMKYREHGSEAFQKMYTNYSMEFKMDVINYMNLSRQFMKIGSRGKGVERVQRELTIKRDGIFGKQTEAAVKAYQERKGLVAHGIVGLKAWNMLF
ncbi:MULTISPECIES: helix-turn-helix domain-containing protein [Parageobacillus]|jgi:transposase-like protein|uniref:Uncharacterized protein n=1 Tax=Parageobacillus thermoglucosidasius TaxID=1426 RepID=A0A1B7KUE2_PARTM|nr:MULTISPECIES: helix-turn-helix domain-containing protein [Parageobacillus]OAT73694.1 hypothetical protein A7K69_18365 [Parageobacillus thermoglucosidasius]BDG48676.1 hypothetical protein PspKH34_32370 [Parageobacillus sp. KH3-4]